MKQRKKALLIAFVLGDGYIHIDKRRPKAAKLALKLCHTVKQREYLEHKVSLLHSVIGGNKPNIIDCTHRFPDGRAYQQVRAEKSHKYFRVLRKWMYPNKYDTLLLKHLTPEAIAIWYMDDGSLIANNRYPDGRCSSARTNLHICTSKEVAENVCEYFQDYWGIKFTAYKEKQNFSIRCFHREGKKFHELIHDFIIPSMAYKQRFYYDTSS